MADPFKDLLSMSKDVLNRKRAERRAEKRDAAWWAVDNPEEASKMTMSKCAALIAATLLLTQTAHSEGDTIHARSVGQHGFMDSDWYICSSWDTYEKFEKLLKLQPAEDAQAAFVLADRDCTKVRDQTEVVVEDTTFWDLHGSICVRPIGQPDCGWVLPGAVTLARCTPTYNGVGVGMTCVPRENQDNPQRLWSYGYSGK
jgi:hypothetical protein